MPTPSATAAIARDIDKLRAEIGTDAAPALRVAYDLIGTDGATLGTVDVTGEPVDGETADVRLRCLAAPFWLLASGSRHTLLPHGRGAGISTTVALYVLGLATASPIRLLAAREIQVSLKDSVHALLRSIIEQHAPLARFFEVQRDVIVGRNGSEIAFRGVRDHTRESIKSAEGISILWGEESQSFSRDSLETLVFTVRAPGSRCFWSWNPTRPTDPISEYFTGERDDVARPSRPFTLADNPLASDTIRREADLLKVRDPERWSHVIGGQIRTYSEARVFSNFVISPDPVDIEAIIEAAIKRIPRRRDIPVAEDRARHARQAERIRNSFHVGCDVGFVDPFTIVLAYLDEATGRIFVLREFYRAGIGPDDMAAALRDFDKPSDRWPVYVDNSRPELVRHFQNSGVNARACLKVPLLERIDALKRFEIIVDPGCENTARELATYEWQQDSQGSVIGDRPRDKDNHTIDALAYALGDKLQSRAPGGGYNRLRDPWTG